VEVDLGISSLELLLSISVMRCMIRLDTRLIGEEGIHGSSGQTHHPKGPLHDIGDPFPCDLGKGPGWTIYTGRFFIVYGSRGFFISLNVEGGRSDGISLFRCSYRRHFT
jgi:hypothetical protein